MHHKHKLEYAKKMSNGIANEDIKSHTNTYIVGYLEAVRETGVCGLLDACLEMVNYLEVNGKKDSLIYTSLKLAIEKATK